MSRFLDKQVNNRLNLIFNNSSSDVIFVLKEPTVSAQVRTAAIRAIKILSCTESALYGLGHMSACGTNQQVYRIIENWIKQARTSRAEWQNYAVLAQQSYIL